MLKGPSVLEVTPNQQRSPSRISFRRDKALDCKSRTENSLLKLLTCFACSPFQKENRIRTNFLQELTVGLQWQIHILFCMEGGRGCWVRNCFVIKKRKAHKDFRLFSWLQDSLKRVGMPWTSIDSEQDSTARNHKILQSIFYIKLPQHPLDRLDPENYSQIKSAVCLFFSINKQHIAGKSLESKDSWNCCPVGLELGTSAGRASQHQQNSGRPLN